MQKLYHFVVLSIFMFGINLNTMAQDTADPTADPLFATVDLAAGQLLDPFLISVTATGTVDASTLGEECVGFVPAAPDVALNWDGEGELLRIFFHSVGDATLAVVTPDGEILCNDDASGTLFDPMVDIEDAANGRYAIHVGHNEPEISYPGFLVITSADVYSPTNFDPELLVPRDILDEGFVNQLPIEILLVDQAPLNGNAIGLEPGFGDVFFDFEESGQIPLFNVQTNNLDCTGFVESLPTVEFTWTGEAEELEVYVEGDHDSSLMVYTPSGDYICNDDAVPGGENLNPSVTFNTPEEGRYVIYVGSFLPGEVVNGTVTITEDLEAQPATLTAEDIFGDE